MDHLTVTEVQVGVHCLNLRHKGIVRPGHAVSRRVAVLRPYDSTAYWCVETQQAFDPTASPRVPTAATATATAATLEVNSIVSKY
jgi:hypothetical protein